METQRRVVCPENEDLASFMWKKRQELAEQPKGISERIDSTLSKAYSNVCNAKNPIKTLKEFSETKGVGKWILRLMQGFFKSDSGGSEPEEELSKKGRKKKGTKRYLPQKNSAAYALLVTLYRATTNGKEFMQKQELIDAAEASGLARVPIAPELGKGKLGHPGSSSREWYSGWNTMKNLITKGLVAKSSCPAKYMLTLEGQEAAAECLSRSGLTDSLGNSGVVETFPSEDIIELDFARSSLAGEGVHEPVDLTGQEKLFDIPNGILEKFTHMGYSVEQIHTAFAKVSRDTQSKDPSSLLSAILHHLQKDQVASFILEFRQTIRKDSCATSNVNITDKVGEKSKGSCEVTELGSACSSSAESAQNSFTLRACSSSDYSGHRSLIHDDLDCSMNVLMMPPVRVGERFEDVYDVILILDDREQFTHSKKGPQSRKIIENIRSEFKIQVEVRRLPIGDAIWLARHKYLGKEYVLDFIVERKEVDDLRCSIRDNRYRDQKLRLLRCGLRKLIFLVEGDPNASEAAESIKTACFTTEILEGMDVQRTSGLGDTLRKYGHLTLAIAHCYTEYISNENFQTTRRCPTFDDFTKKCQDLEKMTVCDVFAIQLMQSSVIPMGATSLFLKQGICGGFSSTHGLLLVVSAVWLPGMKQFAAVKPVNLFFTALWTVKIAGCGAWRDEFLADSVKIPQVTEEIALAVLDLYPTLISLAQAYSLLDGDACAQEEMLKKQSNNLISGVASKNIFQLVWGG